MADIRSLLRNERAARQISHPHATYSTTGTLVCLVCHTQLKSESLWNNHLRSPQHAMRLQRIRDGTLGRPPGAPAPETSLDDEALNNGAPEAKSKKRKVDDGEDEIEEVRKRSKAGGASDDFYEETMPQDTFTRGEMPVGRGQESKLPSRPATPMKTPPLNAPVAREVPAVDEDEWAAYEADIAAAENPIAEEAVISAPAMTAADLATKSKDVESALRKEREEAEAEGDKEDAARMLEFEFEKMQELDQRIKTLKEKREALRVRDGGNLTPMTSLVEEAKVEDNQDDDDDEDDDDDWDGFRLKA